jgi:hypothetical protein
MAHTRRLTMSAMQKFWMFRLAIAGAVAVVAGALLSVFGLSPVVFSACAIFALQPLGRRICGVQASGAIDERDQSIAKTAALAGYSVFWVVFVLSFVGVPFATGSVDGVLEVYGIVMASVPVIGWWILEISRSSIALVLYRGE